LKEVTSGGSFDFEAPSLGTPCQGSDCKRTSFASSDGALEEFYQRSGPQNSTRFSTWN